MNTLSARTKSILNLAAYALVLLVNFLGAGGYINGMSQKQVSDKYPTLITPAPFAFAIWGLIYVLLIATLLYLLVKSTQDKTAAVVHAVTPAWLLSCALNIGWIIAFSYEWMLVSTLLIFAFLFTLTHIVLKLRTLGDKAPWLAALAFGIYTGWLLIATVVNTAATLVSFKWNGFGIAPQTWAVVILAVSVLLAGYVIARLKNAALTLPVAWAYFAILRVHQSASGWAGQYPGVQWAAGIGMVLLLALAVWRFLANGKAVFPKPAAAG